MLEVRDVRKAFAGFQAVGGVTLVVPPRSICATIGPNGAGKTTFFNLITGHLRPDSGTVLLKGRDITGLPPHEICRLGVARSFQRTNIFPRLTVFQNVQAAFLAHHRLALNLYSRVDRFYREETAAILTSIVCRMFLGSWSSALNIILAIQTSIVGTFLVLYFFGFTLNTFTLLGLSLAIGIVVDDAIMVLENIVRHREQGENRVESALKGAKQITFAALAATLAVVAIFLPVAFMRGVIGKFFFQFGITMTVAVLLSLLEALTLTPMRSSTFVQAGNRTTRIGRAADFVFRGVAALYSRWLAIALRNRWKVILGSLAFFAASVYTINFLNKEFMPPQDQGTFIVRLQTPEDSSLEYTDSKFRAAEDVLKTRSEVDRYFSAVGGFSGTGQVNTGIVFVSLKPRGQRGVDPKSAMR